MRSSEMDRLYFTHIFTTIVRNEVNVYYAHDRGQILTNVFGNLMLMVHFENVLLREFHFEIY